MSGPCLASVPGINRREDAAPPSFPRSRIEPGNSSPVRNPRARNREQPSVSRAEIEIGRAEESGAGEIRTDRGTRCAIGGQLEGAAIIFDPLREIRNHGRQPIKVDAHPDGRRPSRVYIWTRGKHAKVPEKNSAQDVRFPSSPRLARCFLCHTPLSTLHPRGSAGASPADTLHVRRERRNC